MILKRQYGDWVVPQIQPVALFAKQRDKRGFQCMFKPLAVVFQETDHQSKENTDAEEASLIDKIGLSVYGQK